MQDPKLPIGTNFCKCAACGEYFTNETNFDMHRRENAGTRYCTHPSELLTKAGKARLSLNAKGYWARPGSFRGEQA